MEWEGQLDGDSQAASHSRSVVAGNILHIPPSPLQDVCSKTDGQARSCRPSSLDDVLTPPFNRSISRRRLRGASRCVVLSSALPVRGWSRPAQSALLDRLSSEPTSSTDAGASSFRFLWRGRTVVPFRILSRVISTKRAKNERTRPDAGFYSTFRGCACKGRISTPNLLVPISQRLVSHVPKA